MAERSSDTDMLGLAAELTMAWLSNPNTRASGEDVPAFLQQMHGAVVNLSSGSTQEEPRAAEEFTPAVSVRKSLASPDHIISMIDGKPYKSLKRHLTRLGLTPAQYRERYGLKADYPMVSDNYSQVRRDMAKKIGLGRKMRGADEAGAAAPDEAPAAAAPAAQGTAKAAKSAKAAKPARRMARKPAEASELQAEAQAW